VSSASPTPAAVESTPVVAAPAPAGTTTPAWTTGSPTGIALRPETDPEVLAALAAAVDQAWPRPRIVVVDEPQRPPAWRFSGRWWSRPATTRRDRPGVGG